MPLGLQAEGRALHALRHDAQADAFHFAPCEQRVLSDARAARGAEQRAESAIDLRAAAFFQTALPDDLADASVHFVSLVALNRLPVNGIEGARCVLRDTRNRLDP